MKNDVIFVILKNNAMKKRYSFFSFLCLWIGVSYMRHEVRAQCSPDPQYTQPGIYPDTITNLPHAMETVPYSTTITFVIPATYDTIIGGYSVTLTVNQVILKGIIGLPANFSYACNTANCTWTGGVSGCALISGNPQIGQAGTYPLIAPVEYYLSGIPTPLKDTAYGYKIVIDPAAHVASLQNEKIRMLPNPAQKEVTFENVSMQKITLDLYNALGEKIHSKSFSSDQPRITMNVSDLPEGIYYVRILTGDATEETRKLVIVR